MHQPGANPVRTNQYATDVIGLRAGRPARLLEVAPGRSGLFYGDWLAQQPDHWREQITVAVLDPCPTPATAAESAARSAYVQKLQY